MFKITRRSSIVVFIIALATSMVAVIMAPQVYFDRVVEVPSLAFFAGEIGFSLLIALLFYESASTSQAVKLAASILGLTMFIGAVGNVIGQSSQMLPEDFVLVNWVQLVIMNLCGIVCCVSLYKLEPEADYAYITGPKWANIPEPPPPKEIVPQSSEEDFTPPREMSELLGASRVPKESASDILGRLDVNRIAELERTLHPESMTMDGLFQDQNQGQASASAGAPNMVSPAQGGTAGAASVFQSDVSADLDNLFADMPGAPLAGGAAQAPPQPASGAAAPADLSEFGRLSMHGKFASEGLPLGTMRTIGKMLLDVSALENIIRAGPAAASRSLTKCVIDTEEGAVIDAMLKKIDAFPLVFGAQLIGYDGLLIATTSTNPTMDQFTITALAFAVHTQTNIGTKKLRLGKLQTSVFQSENKFMVISAIKRGILVVFSEPFAPGGLEGLLGTIAAAQTPGATHEVR